MSPSIAYLLGVLTLPVLAVLALVALWVIHYFTRRNYGWGCAACDLDGAEPSLTRFEQSRQIRHHWRSAEHHASVERRKDGI